MIAIRNVMGQKHELVTKEKTHLSQLQRQILQIHSFRYIFKFCLVCPNGLPLDKKRTEVKVVYERTARERVLSYTII